MGDRLHYMQLEQVLHHSGGWGCRGCEGRLQVLMLTLRCQAMLDHTPTHTHTPTQFFTRLSMTSVSSCLQGG